MKKNISFLLIFTIIAIMFIACAPRVEVDEPQDENIVDEVEEISLRVAAPGGPTTISLVKMFAENPSLGENVEVTYESVKSPDLMAAKIISGEVDFAVIPTNLIANLYNKGVDYKLGASTVWGVLYIAGKDDITGWDDLKGKEITTIGRGLTPDILFRFLLEKNGLDPEKDVKINYLSGPQELAQAVISGQSKIAILPEPVLSTVQIKDTDIKILMDLQEEWELITEKSSYPQSSLFIKNEVVEKHPEVVDAFLREYEESIEWINNNPEEAGIYVEELNIGLTAKVVERSIQGSNLDYIKASDAKTAVEEFLKVLMDFSPDSIGGKLPDEGLYLTK